MQVLSYKSNKANPCINFYKINYFYSISKKKLPHNNICDSRKWKFR